MSLKKGKNVKKIYSNGLVAPTCLAVTAQGLPLGLLDQKIFSRKLRSKKVGQGNKPHDPLPVEEKESHRWLEAPENTKAMMGEAQIITVCDREADLYEFFKLSHPIDSRVLARANADRTINRSSRSAEKGVEKRWEPMRQQSDTGVYTIDIPKRSKTKHGKEREARTATVSVRFGFFRLPPPRNDVQHHTERLPEIEMNALYVLEPNPPHGEKPVERMLLTNLPGTSDDEAYEKVLWHGLRWRIEMHFTVLKSGFRVEACRWRHAKRRARYLTIMSIVAWRLFMITLIARTDSATPCSTLLADHEWKVLFLKANTNKAPPNNPPCIGDVVIWVAKLGGDLARRSDGPPGTITLWRGWKRLADLTEGWNLAARA